MYSMSPTAQVAFQLIPGLISCTEVTGRWGLLSHTQNTVRWHALASRRRWNYKREDGRFLLTSYLSMDSGLLCTSYQLACTWGLGELSLKLGLLCSSALFSVIICSLILFVSRLNLSLVVCRLFFFLSNSNNVFPLIFPITNCCIIAGYSPVFPSHRHSQMTSIHNSPRPSVYEACNGAYLFCVHQTHNPTLQM